MSRIEPPGVSKRVLVEVEGWIAEFEAAERSAGANLPDRGEAWRKMVSDARTAHRIRLQERPKLPSETGGLGNGRGYIGARDQPGTPNPEYGDSFAMDD